MITPDRRADTLIVTDAGFQTRSQHRFAFVLDVDEMRWQDKESDRAPGGD